MSDALRHHDWIRHHRQMRPEAEAVRDLSTGRSLTYSQLDERSDRLAHLLNGLGVGRGDRVALLAHNGPEFFELQFACGRLGAIAVLLNWRLTVNELDFIANDCTPRVLIHDQAFDETAAELVQRAPAIAHRLVIGEDNSSYEQAMAAAEPSFTPVELTHEAPSTIMYTSGTTGHPKGAIITHGMTFWNCVNLGIPARITPETVQLVVLPLFHTGGLNCYANPVLHAGGTVVIQRSFDAGEALAVLGDPAQGITHFFAVPAPYQFMAQHPDFDNTDLSRLQVAGVGGAPCALAILEAWAERGVAVVQGYGMTETSPSVTMLAPHDALRVLGSAGKPLMHTEVRIVTEAGTEAGVGEVGELWVRGPNVTPGYWERPEATEASFVDGWLQTGDAARSDDEGFIFIVDRWKDMYISGGENVYPAEVENVLYRLPEVSEAAVIGVPDERWGEVGMAVIVLSPGHELDRQTVITYCREHLARFKVPAHVRIIEELPRNATGKVLKRELRERFVGPDAPAVS